jgi:hypothetical protein
MPLRMASAFLVTLTVEPTTKTPPVRPTPQQQAYLNALSGLLSWLDTTLDKNQPRFEAKDKLRTYVAKLLRKDAEKFVDGQIDPTKAYENVLIEKGRYLQGADDSYDSNRITITLETNCKLATGLVEHIPDGLHLTDEKATLIDVMTTTQTVFNAVRNQQNKKSPLADKVLDNYTRKLAGIGRVGLVTDPKLGLAQVYSLQRDYLANEAPRIKHLYVSRLFVISLVLFVAAYLYARWHDFTEWPDLQLILRSHKEFFLLAAGAAVGAWLSFSSRDQNLAFADLGSLDGDFAGPLFLVLFATGFTTVVGLLFWTGALTVGLGNMSSSNIANASIALLIGLFCGLSERALATGISARAATFVQGVGGASGKQ